MEAVPDEIHKRIRMFASRHEIEVGEARNIILKSAITKEGEGNEDFLTHLSNELGLPY